MIIPELAAPIPLKSQALALLKASYRMTAACIVDIPRILRSRSARSRGGYLNTPWSLASLRPCLRGILTDARGILRIYTAACLALLTAVGCAPDLASNAHAQSNFPGASTPTATAADAYRTIKSRLRADIFSTIEQSERSTWKVEEIAKELKLFDLELGRYRDLNYENSQADSTWGPQIHLSRLLKLATAFHLEGHPYRNSSQSLALIRAGVDQWTRWQFENHNWWMNEIGTPTSAYRLYLLMQPYLKVDQLRGLEKIIERCKTFSSNRGQNLVWYAELFIALGVIQGDSALVTRGLRGLDDSFVVGQDEGLQADGSFFQHGPVLYNGGYGAEFALNLSRFALIVSGTPFEFSTKQLQMLYSYVLDANAWFIRGDQINPSVLGRYYTRPTYGSQYFLRTCRYLGQTQAPRAAEARECAQRIERREPQGLRNGNQLFWQSDFMIQSSPLYSASVKMLSSRNLNADTTPNQEGFLNDYISDGVTYFFNRGDEYQGIFPLLDYTLLPGTTELDRSLIPRVDQRLYGVRDFVGGASDGRVGVAAMDFARGALVPSPHYSKQASMDFSASELLAKKAWFFGEKSLVALGAGISHREEIRWGSRVRTSINQSWARGPLTLGGVGAKSRSGVSAGRPLLPGFAHEGSVSWFHQDQFAYVNLSPDSVIHVAQENREGSWSRISGNQAATPVKGSVFSAWIDHGVTPTNASYAYAVVPGVNSADTVPALVSAMPWRILENTVQLQAVENQTEGWVQAVFYEPGQVAASWIQVASSRRAFVSLRQVSGTQVSLAVTAPGASAASPARLVLSGAWQCPTCQASETGTTVVVPRASDPQEPVVIRLTRP